jgi:hypothetical protein
MPVQDVGAAIRGRFETARELAFGDITSSFKIVGSAMDLSCYISGLQNFTDVYIDISISFAGDSTVLTLAPNGGAHTYDLNTNAMLISQGEAVWAKYRTGAPTTGFIQVIVVAPVATNSSF